MKKILLGFLMLMVLVGCGQQNDVNKKFKIGVLQWASHPALDDAHKGLVDGLDALGVLDDFEIDLKIADDDASNANMMVSQFVNDGVDLIYAIATPAAQSALSQTEGTEIPIIFNAVTDAVSAGLVESNENPGGRVSGVSDMAPIDIQLGLIKEFIPEVKSVGVLYNTSEDNSIHQIALIESLISNHGMTLNVQGIAAPGDIALAAEHLVSSSDALYIITDNTVAAATAQVVSIANEVKVPVFMAESGQFDQGILATDSISYHGLGVQASKMVYAILIEGKSPSEIPVEISTSTELLVSEKVAHQLGIEIPDSILERADLR